MAQEGGFIFAQCSLQCKGMPHCHTATLPHWHTGTLAECLGGASAASEVRLASEVPRVIMATRVAALPL